MNKENRKSVSFQDDVQYLPTYTPQVQFCCNQKADITNNSQEYERGDTENAADKEEDIEKQIENLNILVLNTDYETLRRTSFVDYHIMLGQLEEEEEPACDFGIFVSFQTDSDLQSSNRIQFGDFVIALNDEDLLEATAAQLKVLISDLDKNTNHQITLGRRNGKPFECIKRK